MPRRWVKQLGVLAAWLVFALVLGLWLGALPWVLVAAAGIYLARTLWNLYVLDRFLSTGRRPVTVGTRGLWPELAAGVERLRAKAVESKRRYLRLLREVKESTDAVDGAGVILNSEREIVWFNPAATRLLGLDPARDIGQRIGNLIRHPQFLAYLAKPASAEEIVIPMPDKPNGMLSIALRSYGDEQYVAIARDVTHETMLERTRRDFIANASHELRSPLTVINGYLDALVEDDEIPPSWEVPVGEMLRQTHRMTQILRDLIELARLESSEQTAKHDFVPVPVLLERIVEQFEVFKDRPEIVLDVQADWALLGNESELYSVFRNLLDNAVRFTPQTGKVVVTWRSEGGGAVYEVSDTGIGIAAELIPRLTERFYRVDPGRSRASGGTGLGLAIVKHALQRHGATLEIQSDEGRGSKFLCRFPATRVVLRSSRDTAVI